MKYPFIETIPDVLKLHRPSMYEGESFTALEYVSKIAVKINECIAEFNSFATDVSNICDEYKDNYEDKQELFQRTMEQRFSDFIEVIKLKYASQDAVIQEAVATMLNSMPDYIREAINKLYSNGEFDAIVYQSIANLKRDFDSIVNNTNAFQTSINEAFVNLSNDMQLFKQNTRTELDEVVSDLNERFDNLVSESEIADMQKNIYDTNNDGVVDDSEKLGGQLPDYYAKRQDLNTTNGNINTINNSISNISTQIATMQTSVSDNTTKVNNAIDTANTALEEAGKKLGATETAVDSSKLNGQQASYYATATHTHTASEVGLGNVTNSEQMPIAGGTFTGNVKAYETARTTRGIFNEETRASSTSGTAQSVKYFINVT